MIFIVTAIVSFLLLSAIVFDQILNLRRGLVGVEFDETTLAHKVALPIESTALNLTLASRRVSSGFYLRTLLILRRAAGWFGNLFHQLERKVLALISSARVGRVRLTKDDLDRERASVSFFLAQIKEHQDELSRRTSRTRSSVSGSVH